MHASKNPFLDRRGQSSIETVVVLGTLIFGAIFILRMALKFILFLSVDDLLESYLMCSAFQPEPYCRTELQRKVTRIHLNFDSIQIIDSPDRITAHLQVSNGLYETVQRSREYIKR